MSGIIIRGLVFGALIYLVRTRGKIGDAKTVVREVLTSAVIFTFIVYILELIL